MIITEIETQDLASQLAKETITSYEAEDATVATIVSALLAFQVQTPAIAVGTIDGAYSALTRSIKVDGDTILRALYRLRDTVGGYIYVDNDRQLQWASSIGEDKGQQIRYRKNLKGIEREIDYTKLFNRIYAYGAGEGEARIELTAPGYIEDETSQTEWGGIYPAVFVERSITHPDTLLAWANLLLGEYKNPPICYRIDAVDLSKSEELGFSFEALQLGSTITVIDEDLGIDVSVIVVKIEHPDLLHPEQITLELANRTKDITDTLAEVYDTQQLEQHIATKIGAGQVIVKGVFTVIDWVTAGETTIDGGNITAGTIIADAIGAGTITGKTIIISGADGILKSSNYVANSEGWQIKGNGIAEFNTVMVRGTIFTSSIAGGNTLTINGLISAGDGHVIIGPSGINIWGMNNALTTRATVGGAIQCYVGADGCIYAGAGNIKLNSGGLGAYGGSTLRIYTSASVYRGCIGAEGADFAIVGIGGNIALEAAVDIVLSPSGDVHPLGTTKYLGNSSNYWGRVYANTYYGKNATIQSFQNHDDIALIKAIKAKHIILKANKKRRIPRREIDVIDIDSLPPEIILEEGGEKFINMGGLSSLALGAIKQMADKVEALETRING